MANLLLNRFPSILSPPPSHPSNQFALLPSTRPSELQLRTSGSISIKCMATPRRVKMVAKQVMRELSDMLLTDKNLQYAILPEAALGADHYLSSLTTSSDVEVSTDLQVIAILDKIKNENQKKSLQILGKEQEASDLPFEDDNEDWEEEDGDEEIIYVE